MKCALYTICDNKFIDAGLIMLYSFLVNNQWFNGNIIVLHTDLDYWNRSRLMALNEKIVLKEINTKEYEPLMEAARGITSPTLMKSFYKYELFRDAEHDIIIWADADMIFNASIEDVVTYDADFSWCEDKLYIGKKSYFNTGFFIFKNIECVKNGTFYNELLNFTLNLKSQTFSQKVTYKGFFADQDILNEMVHSFFANIKVLPTLEYNFPQQMDDWNLINKAKIIHYLGGDKPFLKDKETNHLAHYLWYFYYYQLNC
jgi:lipopolysaccharide biosynthesis glycosyltransferase